MKISHIALACALAIGGSAAIAQNESTNKPNANGSVSASEVAQKAKRGAKRVGDATKRGFNKLRGKAADAQARNDAKSGSATRSRSADQSRSTTASNDSMAASSSSRQQRIDDAYANYKSGDRK